MRHCLFSATSNRQIVSRHLHIYGKYSIFLPGECAESQTKTTAQFIVHQSATFAELLPNFAAETHKGVQGYVCRLQYPSCQTNPNADDKSAWLEDSVLAARDLRNRHSVCININRGAAKSHTASKWPRGNASKRGNV